MKEINAALGIELAPKDMIALGFPPDQLERKRTFWTSEHVSEAAAKLAAIAAALSSDAANGNLPMAESTPMPIRTPAAKPDAAPKATRKPRAGKPAAAPGLPPGFVDFDDSEL